MLFMIIERYKDKDAVYKRFREISKKSTSTIIIVVFLRNDPLDIDCAEGILTKRR